MAANGRALATGATDGMVKLVADAKTDKLLGVQIVARGGLRADCICCGTHGVRRLL